jgi:hypothetical protein
MGASKVIDENQRVLGLMRRMSGAKNVKEARGLTSLDGVRRSSREREVNCRRKSNKTYSAGQRLNITFLFRRLMENAND